MAFNLTQKLTKYGLLEREAEVYLAVLALDESPVIPIAKKSGIQRTYVYDILQALQLRGLVTALEKSGRRVYRAEHPRVLERQLQERLQDFKETMPELLSLYITTPGKPRVRFYEGKEGVLAVFDELLEEEAYDNLGEPDNFTKVMGEEYTREIGRQIAERRIHTRELYCRPTQPLLHNEHYDNAVQEIRFLPEGHHITTDVCISETKVYLISLEQNPHAVIIEDSGIVHSQAVMFEVMWQGAGK